MADKAVMDAKVAALGGAPSMLAAAGEGAGERKECPESGSWLVPTQLVFGWVTPLFHFATRKRELQGAELEDGDLWDLQETDQTDAQTRIFQARWDELVRARGAPQSSAEAQRYLKSAIWAIIRRGSWWGGFYKFLASSVQFLYPFLINWLLTFILNTVIDQQFNALSLQQQQALAQKMGQTLPPNLTGPVVLDLAGPVWKGYVYAVAFGLAMVAKAVVENLHFWCMFRAGWKARSVVSTAVYRKSLRLTASARQARTLGEIVNLMQLDSAKIEGFINMNMWVLVDGLYQIAGYVIILYYYIEWPAFVGLAFMLVAVPIQGIMFGKTMAINRSMVKYTDQRVKMTNEILQGILGIKMAGLESKYAEVVNKSREQEITSLKRVVYLSAFNTTFMTCMPSATAVLSLTVYALVQDGNVSAPTLFTALTAFGQLRFPLMFYPQALIALSQAKVSIKRVADFLALEEIGSASAGGSDAAASGSGGADHASPAVAAAPLASPTVAAAAPGSPASGSPLASPSGSTRALQQVAAVEIKDGEFFWARPGTSASMAAVKAAEAAANMSRKERKMQKKKLSLMRKTSSSSSAVPGAADNNSSNIGKVPNISNGTLPPSFRGKDMTTGISVRGVNNDLEAAAPERTLEERAVLTGINLRVAQGSLVAVIGPVGSGKSSLVSSILDEMYRGKGSLSVSGSVAYASQTAWILNATVRENILFGQPMDERRYHKVVKACQLAHDLEVLEAGDQTMIGERGINLSGGQKQRISVARAVYSNRDIIILDDPLSALDPEVAAKVFNLCFKKLLRGKTRILVTNQLQFLEHCDSVVVLDAQPNAPGRIVEHGPYKRLITSGLNFQRVMANYNSSGQDDQRQEAATAAAAALLKVDEADEDLEEEDRLSAGAPDDVAQRRDQDRDQDQDRPDSQDSQDSQTDEAEPAAAKKPAKALMQVEERSKGAVPLSIYLAYAKAGGNYPWFASFVLLLFLVAQLAVLINTWWLTFWTSDTNQPTPYSEHPFSFYLWGYFLTVVALALIAYGRSLGIYFLALRASMQLHNGLLTSVLHAPMSYFDTTPIGRIVSRFSKDLYLLDTQLVMSVQFFLFTVFFVIFSFGAIAYGVPWFLLSLPVVCYLYLLALNYYRPLARDSKRLESISRSPIFAHFSETLGGLTTIRAYGISDEFARTNARMVDDNIKCYFVTVAIQRWLALRLEWLGACISVLAAVLSVVAAQNGQLTASRAGFSLSFLFGLTNLLNQTVRQFADVETGMNSVERLLHYTTNIEQEAAFESPTPPPKGWPERGEIVVKDLRMRYRKDTPLVLKGVSIKIPSGSRVGIVGRTGSGKSSMLLTLLRLVEPEPSSDGSGPILIDGVDTCKIGLHELRQHISIVPQNPTIFSGTVRSNLDPFQAYSDENIWAALAECEMKAAVEEAGGLDGAVAEYGENFSQGQRQLICLTKSVLSKAKILMLDEATSAIDFETDAAIQKTLRHAFKAATILTIAHRLNTVIDSDLVLVMDAGLVAEFDAPDVLLRNPDGVFSHMVNETGEKQAAALKLASSRRLVG